MKIDPEKRLPRNVSPGSFPRLSTETQPAESVTRSADPGMEPPLRHSERELLLSLSRRIATDGAEATWHSEPRAPIVHGFFRPTEVTEAMDLELRTSPFQWKTPLVRPSSPTTGKRRVSRDSFLEVSVVVLLALFLALLLKTYVAEAYMIRGHSMNPTFEDQQRVMVLKSFYGIEHGDIVIFNSKTDPNKDLIKRIIGLPGDVVEVRDGHVIRNGLPLDEQYITEYKYHRGENYPPITVPDDEFYVLGDNRPQSQDSRKFSTVPVIKIKGKVVLRWWPASELTTF